MNNTIYYGRSPNLDLSSTCCITGHRPQKLSFGFNESHKDCIQLKSSIKSKIIDHVNCMVNIFITGMALGVDMLTAETVLDLKTDFNLQLVAAIPHIDQHKKWNAEYQTRYFEILSCYDIVYIVRDKYTKDCFQKRNEWMVDNSQYVIGVYDDSISSGSKNCINYAKKQHRIISIINTN